MFPVEEALVGWEVVGGGAEGFSEVFEAAEGADVQVGRRGGGEVGYVRGTVVDGDATGGEAVEPFFGDVAGLEGVFDGEAEVVFFEDGEFGIVSLEAGFGGVVVPFAVVVDGEDFFEAFDEAFSAGEGVGVGDEGADEVVRVFRGRWGEHFCQGVWVGVVQLDVGVLMVGDEEVEGGEAFG